eukprot:4944393-Pleurochrysis_carterae.AAC.3
MPSVHRFRKECFVGLTRLSRRSNASDAAPAKPAPAAAKQTGAPAAKDDAATAQARRQRAVKESSRGLVTNRLASRVDSLLRSNTLSASSSYDCELRICLHLIVHLLDPIYHLSTHPSPAPPTPPSPSSRRRRLSLSLILSASLTLYLCVHAHSLCVAQGEADEADDDLIEPTVGESKGRRRLKKVHRSLRNGVSSLGYAQG